MACQSHQPLPILPPPSPPAPSHLFLPLLSLHRLPLQRTDPVHRRLQTPLQQYVVPLKAGGPDYGAAAGGPGCRELAAKAKGFSG